MRARLAETKEYMENPQIHFVSNNQRFDLLEYSSDKVIINEALISSRIIDLSRPHW
jgi:hypothetical protein